MSDTPQTQYTPAEAAFAARVSAETGEEAVFVFAYNLSFDNEFIDGFAAVAGGALYAADSPGGALKKNGSAGRRRGPLCAECRLRGH